MPNITDYTAKITGEHADKPKYMAMVEALAQSFFDTGAVARDLPEGFDLDRAIGAQLDSVGLWVGVSRDIDTPLAGIYFALDTKDLGLDQGAWRGPYDPENGLTTLDDETYRTLIRARIGANHWDGSLEQSKSVLELVFKGETFVFIEDNQDMSITVGVAGKPLSAIERALLTGGYIPIKPQSVSVAYYIVPTLGGALFGFDVSNQHISGFDQGSWGEIFT